MKDERGAQAQEWDNITRDLETARELAYLFDENDETRRLRADADDAIEKWHKFLATDKDDVQERKIRWALAYRARIKLFEKVA
jgi:hypothetical protein